MLLHQVQAAMRKQARSELLVLSIQQQRSARLLIRGISFSKIRKTQTTKPRKSSSELKKLRRRRQLKRLLLMPRRLLLMRKQPRLPKQRKLLPMQKQPRQLR
jgi:hypothetical protein